MSGFSIGGLGTGIQKGANYDVQFLREVVWAIRTGNQAARDALAHIAATNLKEWGDTGQEITQSHAVAILFEHDPFQGSRQLMHDFEAKFGKH